MSILWRLIGLMRPIRRHTVMPKDLQGLIARSGNQMDGARGVVIMHWSHHRSALL